MKKIIAGIALAAIFAMGSTTDATALFKDKEVQAEITSGYPNIAVDGKALEKQVATAIKLFKTANSKAKAFNTIAKKELVKGTNVNETLDYMVTQNHLEFIIDYLEKAKKAIAAIYGFKSKDTFGIAITNATPPMNFDNLQTNIFLELSNISSVSDKAKKAAIAFHTALCEALRSVQNITRLNPTVPVTQTSTGQLRVAYNFFNTFHTAIDMLKRINVPAYAETQGTKPTTPVSQPTTNANFSSGSFPSGTFSSSGRF